MSFAKIRDAGRLSADQETLREEYYKNYEASVSRYKFQAFDKLKFLSSAELFISDPANFNDPFDIKLAIRDDIGVSGFTAEALQAAMSVALQHSPEIRQHWFYDDETFRVMQQWAARGIPLVYVAEAIERRFRKLGVACFSTEWNSPLMWAHYGSSHQGLCLQYFVRPMTLATDENVLQYPVNYTTILPSIPLTETLFSPRNVGQRIIATKSIEWAYEKEWRLVHLATKGSAAPMPEGIKLGSIIVGLSAGQDHRRQAFEKGNELQVPVFEVDRSYEGYGFLLDVTWPN